MRRVDIVQPYVEKILKEVFETDELIVDEGGEWPFRRGTAIYRVRLLEGDPPVLQVWSQLLTGAKKSAKLLETLSDMNAQIHFARVFLVDHMVVAATELVADTLDQQEVVNALSVVSGVADHYDNKLQAEFGGETAFAEESQEADAGDV